MNPIIPTITTITENGNHNGAVTHHHDQSMLFVNFKPRNNRNSNVPNPIPLLLLEFSILIYLFVQIKDNQEILIF